MASLKKNGLEVLHSSGVSISRNHYNYSGQGIKLMNVSSSSLTKNIIKNCDLFTDNSSCINILGSNLNTFDYNNLSNSSKNGIQFGPYLGYNSSHNLIKGESLANAGNNSFLIFINESGQTNQTFTNVSYANLSEYVASGSEIFRKWYLIRFYVNDSEGIT